MRLARVSSVRVASLQQPMERTHFGLHALVCGIVFFLGGSHLVLLRA